MYSCQRFFARCNEEVRVLRSWLERTLHSLERTCAITAASGFLLFFRSSLISLFIFVFLCVFALFLQRPSSLPASSLPFIKGMVFHFCSSVNHAPCQVFCFPSFVQLISLGQGFLLGFIMPFSVTCIIHSSFSFFFFFCGIWIIGCTLIQLA